MAERVTRIAARSRGLRLSVRPVGMPEVAAAVEARRVRGEVHVARSPQGLGAEPIELAAEEEIIWRAPISIPSFFEGAPAFGAEVVLIAKRAALPRLRIGADDARVAELARLLVAQEGGR
jgi:hypothetical protein